MATMKVKPWGKDQGEFVIIDAENFNADFHEAFDKTPKKVEKKPCKKGVKKDDN